MHSDSLENAPTLLPMQVAQRAEHEMLVVSDQGDVDAAFADMEHLLDADRHASKCDSRVCADCGCGEFVYCGSGSPHPGSRVCTACGVVQAGNIYFETMYGKFVPTRGSNYKRIHHWHERISQLLIHESPIPRHEMQLIAEKLCDGTHQVLNKDTIRTVLRSLNLQLYIEKWLQIIYRLTDIRPPCPGPLLIQQLDSMFHELQRPFNTFKMEGRKNFLNYNYVFRRLFQAIGCPKFSMFFPLIKSPSKLRHLDKMWEAMAKSLNWEVTPLLSVPCFSVQLADPSSLLARLASQPELQSPVERSILLPRKLYHASDRMKTFEAQSSKSPRPSSPLAPELQRLGLTRRRLR